MKEQGIISAKVSEAAVNKYVENLCKQKETSKVSQKVKK